MHVNPIGAHSWRPDPRSQLSDRQTEENLWLALAEQKDEHCMGLAQCLEVSANTAPGYNQHLVRMTPRQRLGWKIAAVGAACFPVTFAGLYLTPDATHFAALAVVGMGTFVGGLVTASSEPPPESEKSWRHNTLRTIEQWREEAGQYRREAAQVHRSTQELRLVCSSIGSPSLVGEKQESVTLGAVRLRKKLPQENQS
ncbi:MAG: hypothetical protein AMXMBFR33_71160 [Candidatus Xenobia bacterium]